MRGLWMTAAALAALVCPAVLGQMSYTAQVRSISATGPGGGPALTRSAPDFAPFTARLISDGPQGGSATADLTTSLNVGSLALSGNANPGANAQGQFGSADVQFDITFDVTHPSAYILNLSYAHATFSLVGPGVNLNYGGPSGGANPTGTLAVGRYRLVAQSSGAIQSGRALRGLLQIDLVLQPLEVPISTAFTYQGRLESSGAPLEGTADLMFRLRPSAEGSGQVGPTLVLTNAQVHGGLVSTLLDFGVVFEGRRRFLEVAVRSPAGTGPYVTLSPRQELTLAPNAGFALIAGTAGSASTAGSAGIAGQVPWAGVTGVPGNVSGAFSPFAADTNGITYAAGNLGLGGASVATDTGAVWGGLTVDAGGLAIGTAPLNSTEFYGIRFGAATSGEGISSTRTAGNTQFGLDFFTGRVNRVSILSSGRVGIGTTAPDQLLTVNGNASKPGGGSWAVFSDPSLKEGVRPMQGTLDRLLTLRGYRYTYKAEAVSSGRALPGEQLGLMADEVERVFPDWVSRSADGYRMVTERSTTALMVEALRDLRLEKDRQIDRLEAELASRQRALEDLRARMDALERR